MHITTICNYYIISHRRFFSIALNVVGFSIGLIVRCHESDLIRIVIMVK